MYKDNLKLERAPKAFYTIKTGLLCYLFTKELKKKFWISSKTWNRFYKYIQEQNPVWW